MGQSEQMTSGAVETEVKLPVRDIGEVTLRLRKAGYSVSVPREFESNSLYDSPERRLTRTGMALRLRQAGERSIITWKGPAAEAGPHKTRPELETTVGSVAVLSDILTRLGYEVVFRYEKFRTEFRRQEALGSIVLDETPIGAFLELEGPGDWIDKAAMELGFSPVSYILDSYASLYTKQCRENGRQPMHMLFSS
jgi:adenylate cyclase, class 2